MKFITVIFLYLVLIPSLSYANCSEAVTKQISQNGKLNESDKTRMIEECESFQKFRLAVKKDPSAAFVLQKTTFTCGERNDYVDIYNSILERGGDYNPQAVDKYKSCRAIQNPTLVKIIEKKDNDPVVKVIYPNQYNVYYLHTQWVLESVLVPYSTLLKGRIK